MKNKLLPLFFFMFALSIAMGGVMGYIKAHSLISLIMSSIFSATLSIGALLLYKRQVYGYYLTFGATILLDIVFFIRYLRTQSLVPGIMTIYCFLALIAGYYLLKNQSVNLK